MTHSQRKQIESEAASYAGFKTPVAEIASYLCNAFLVGAQYRETMEGMRWVKASERMPVKPGRYAVKRFGEIMAVNAAMYENGNIVFVTPNNMQWKGWREFEWLDEQATPDSEVKRQDGECQHPFYDCYQSGLKMFCGKCGQKLT